MVPRVCGPALPAPPWTSGKPGGLFCNQDHSDQGPKLRRKPQEESHAPSVVGFQRLNPITWLWLRLLKAKPEEFLFICFYFGEMTERGEGFKLNGARVFDQRQFFFVWPRPSSRLPTQIVICCQSLEPFCVCLNKTGDPGSSWGAGTRSQAAPNSEMENFFYENSFCCAWG